MKAALCAGYLGGMMEMNGLYQSLVVEPDAAAAGRDFEAGLFCLPTNDLGPLEVVRVVVTYLEQMSIRELRQSSKRVLVLGALAKAFPCARNR